MKPFWRSEKHGLAIYHGDCLEVLPQLAEAGEEFDLCLTDPPYGIERGSGHGNLLRGKGNYRECVGWTDDPDYVRAVCVKVVEMVREIVSRVVVTPGNRCLMHYPEPDDIGCLYAPAAKGCGKWGFAVHNPILFYGKDPRNAQAPAGAYITSTTNIKGHPCAKPLEAWEWLVERASFEGQRILDPFLGSGTTLVAAYRLGRTGAGIEIDEQYCELAAKRLERELAQGRLFEPAEIAQPRQHTLLEDE